jgi:hypothetical protein
MFHNEMARSQQWQTRAMTTLIIARNRMRLSSKARRQLRGQPLMKSGRTSFAEVA